MATITLEYDAHNSFAASLIDAIKKSGVFKIEKPAKTKKCGLDMALEDIKEGRVREIQDVTAYFKNLGANRMLFSNRFEKSIAVSIKRGLDITKLYIVIDPLAELK